MAVCATQRQEHVLHEIARRRGTAPVPHGEHGLKGGIHGGSKDNSLKQRLPVAERVKHSEQLLCVLPAALLRAVPRIRRLAISAWTLVVLMCANAPSIASNLACGNCSKCSRTLRARPLQTAKEVRAAPRICDKETKLSESGTRPTAILSYKRMNLAPPSSKCTLCHWQWTMPEAHEMSPSFFSTSFVPLRLNMTRKNTSLSRTAEPACHDNPPPATFGTPLKHHRGTPLATGS